MPESEPTPLNQETDARYNAEPGIALIPGSNYLKEVAKFEQFHGKYTMGTDGPGNPYQYREFPKMLYRADKYQGQIRCMAGPPDPYLEWRDRRELERAQEAATRFSEQCQRTVKDEREQTVAFEQGWRETPEAAVEWLRAKERAISEAAAHLNYENRNLSERAQAEVARAREAAHEEGHHLTEVPEAPISRAAERIVADGQCNGKTGQGSRCSRPATTTDGLFCKTHAR